MNVKRLSPEDWSQLAPVFEREFVNDALPNPEEAEIVGAYDGDKLVGFIVVENLIHLAQVYVTPERRSNGVGAAMAAYIERLVPQGRSVVTIAQSSEGGRMAESWLFTKIPGQVYRRVK